MSRQVGCARLLLFLSLAVRGGARCVGSQGRPCQGPEDADAPACPGLGKWMDLLSDVDKDIETDFSSDDDTITVGASVLGKFKRTPEYGCILEQMFKFYAAVLGEGQRRWRKFEDQRHALERLKMCMLKVHCPKMCRKISRQAKKSSPMKVRNVRDLNPAQLARYQIQKLQRAKKQLRKKESRALERALVELKVFPYYDRNTDVQLSSRACRG